MDMTGSRHIEAPRQRVWEALNDPAVLQAAIPGCESVERTGDDSFAAGDQAFVVGPYEELIALLRRNRTAGSSPAVPRPPT